MKQYRLKSDIKHPLFYLMAGTIAHRYNRDFVYFKTSSGSEFVFLRKHIDQDNEWVETVQTDLNN